jgi:beta-lactamase regulating signal transducer with metallopeptidase domain
MTPDAVQNFHPAADSARVIAEAYTVSLIAFLPLLVAGASVIVLSRRSAFVQATIWRCAVVATAALCLARLLPHREVLWMLPDGLAAPLVSLERAAMTGADPQLPSQAGELLAIVPRQSWPQSLVALYLAGLVLAAVRLQRGKRAVRRLVQSARPVTTRSWNVALHRARRACDIRGEITLVESDRTRTPFACGTLQRVIVVPVAARTWTGEEREAALLHEMAHHKRRDVFFAELAMWLGVVLWFHPAVRVMTRRAAHWAEVAADDVVLARGIRSSTYAALLARIAQSLAPQAIPHPAAGFVHGGLRARLQRIVHLRDREGAPGRAHAGYRVVVTAMLAAIPLGAVQLAPTRTVLDSLMLDGRWDTRAYAVTRLAQRADSIEVARAAASHDPSPRVRAWAARAVARHPIDARFRR